MLSQESPSFVVMVLPLEQVLGHELMSGGDF
jgi:hypothetical protein